MLAQFLSSKNGEEITKNISYILQFTDSARFVGVSLSNLVNNLSEGIQSIKFKFRNDDKKCESCGNNYDYCNCFLENIIFEDDSKEYKSLCCNTNYQHMFDGKLKEQFFNTYKFYNLNNNKFILLLQKGVYPYEYRNDWKKFNETSLPKNFHSHLNIEDITDADHMHAKRVCRRILSFLCS